MTLTRLIETGSGELAARLVIEGLPIELVSDPDMERITPLDGRERVYCFDLFGEASLGLVIDETVNLPEALLEAPGATIRLVETDDERLAQVFWHEHDQQWFVAATVEVADTSIHLLSAEGISPGDIVYLGTETMLVTGVDGSTIHVTRGYRQSIAQKHWSNEPGINIAYRKLTNRPVRIRGRRVYLYLYGDADDLQTDGTQVWVGHVSSEPALDDAGTVWRIQLTNIAERLKGTLGGELENPFYPRGIYYTASAALDVRLAEFPTPGAILGAAAAGLPKFTGFYETQEDFCDALTVYLGQLASGLGLASTYRAIPTADGRWTVEVTVGTGVTDVIVWVESKQDGSTFKNVDNVDGSGSVVPGISPGDVVYPQWIETNSDDRMVPRGYFGGATTSPLGEPTATGTAPPYRVHVDRSVSHDWTSVRVDWPGLSFVHDVETVDVPGNWLKLGVHGFLDDSRRRYQFRYGAHSLISMQPLRSFGRGTLADLRAELVAAGPEYCNRAGVPFLTNADIAPWTTVVNDAASGRPWLQDRMYAAGSSIELEELLSHEMRLYGLFPVIEADGRIGVRSLLRVVEGGTPVNLDEEIVSVGWSSMERGNQTVNTVVLRTGYDPREDEWTGITYTVQNEDSYSLDHEKRELEIEPRSFYRYGEEFITYDAASLTADLVTNIFGFPHGFATVNVSWQHFNLRLGDPVTFSADHLPDYHSGRRPMVDVRGIVVGRRWALGEAHGTLRLLIHGINVGGYAPTARVLSQSGSGTTWTLTVSPTLYAPAEGPPASFFAEGYAIRLIQYDSESPTVAAGTVTAVSGNDISVELKEAWAPGSATWELCFAPWDECPEEQRQRFAFIADSNATINGGSPYLYAPG